MTVGTQDRQKQPTEHTGDVLWAVSVFRETGIDFMNRQ